MWRVPATRYALHWDRAERLTSGPGHATAMAVSPDGHRVAFTAESRQTRAWVFPFDPIGGRLTGSGKPVTPEDTDVGNLRLLPDGSLLYSSMREGRQRMDVMLTDVQTGRTRLIAQHAAGIAASPDGRTFTYRLTRPRSGTKVDTRSAEVEFAAAVRDRSGSERLVSDWSAGLVATGDWLADGSAAIASHWNPFPGGKVSLVFWPLTRGAETKPSRVLLADPERAFWQASLSPDQRFASFVAASSGQHARLQVGIMALDDVAGRWWRVAEDHRWADKPRWAPDGRTLYFISRKPFGYYNLWGVRLDPATARPISAPFQISRFDTPAMSIEPNVVVSDIFFEGNRLAVTMRNASGSIWMMSDVEP